MKKSPVIAFLSYSIGFVLVASLAPALFATGINSLPAGIISEPALLWNPGRLDVDDGSVLFAVDAYKNRVHRFDRSGRHLGFIRIERPSAIATGKGGTVYIGSHKDYSVAICRDGACSGFLGNGRDEFSSVLDIAVDRATGDVYVVDGIRETVRVYSSAGVPQASFSGLDSPVAVAVTGEEVFVLDAPRIPAAKGGGTGSRISVFSKSGAFLRNIDDRGNPDRSLIRPVDIAADRLGNLFIADAGRRSVLVYDRDGRPAGEITGQPGMLRNPVSLALSGDGRLYVGSSETHSIVEVGLAGTVYCKTGSSLDFQSAGRSMSMAALGY